MERTTRERLMATFVLAAIILFVAIHFLRPFFDLKKDELPPVLTVSKNEVKKEEKKNSDKEVKTVTAFVRSVNFSASRIRNEPVNEIQFNLLKGSPVICGINTINVVVVLDVRGTTLLFTKPTQEKEFYSSDVLVVYDCVIQVNSAEQERAWNKFLVMARDEYDRYYAPRNVEPPLLSRDKHR